MYVYKMFWKSLLVRHHTALGWALVGESCNKTNSGSKPHSSYKTKCSEHFSAHLCFRTNVKSQQIASDIFKEHEDQELPGLSREDEKFLLQLNNELCTDSNGSIVLPLPFKSDKTILPNNSMEVLSHTKNTLARLRNDPVKLDECTRVMQKYCDAGHVEMVPEAEQHPVRPGEAWWIPIFPVVHAKKKKLRLVFDSSARYHRTCLNDHLLQGSDMNNRLKHVLIGFRNSYIGFSADVESMFHNFSLKPEHRDYLRYFWFTENNSSKDISQYRAKVHIFSNCSSPAVATLGIRYAANADPALQHVQSFVADQFYVDDGMSCADTVDEAVCILHDTKETLAKFNIRLNKICSSSPDVLKTFLQSELSTGTTTI